MGVQSHLRFSLTSSIPYLSIVPCRRYGDDHPPTNRNGLCPPINEVGLSGSAHTDPVGLGLGHAMDYPILLLLGT